MGSASASSREKGEKQAISDDNNGHDNNNNNESLDGVGKTTPEVDKETNRAPLGDGPASTEGTTPISAGAIPAPTLIVMGGAPSLKSVEVVELGGDHLVDDDGTPMGGTGMEGRRCWFKNHGRGFIQSCCEDLTETLL